MPLQFAHWLAIDQTDLFISGRFVAGDQDVFRVAVFPITALGPVSPSRTLIPPQQIGTNPCIPQALVVSPERIFELFPSCGPGPRVFSLARNGSGEVLFLAQIIGPHSGLVGSPVSMKLFLDELYVVDAAGAVRVYPIDDASGDPAPNRSITGPQTALAQPVGIAVY
jgi:hypothetical protein